MKRWLSVPLGDTVGSGNLIDNENAQKVIIAQNQKGTLHAGGLWTPGLVTLYSLLMAVDAKMRWPCRSRVSGHSG